MKRRPKAVLITGATKRLGFAFTKQTLAMGFSVVAHHRRGTAALGSWLRRHPSYAARVHFVQADITDNPAALIAQALKAPVSLVGLVNNASLFTHGNLNDLAHFEKTLATNVDAPLRLAIEFSRRVRSGWIVNITDAHAAPLNRTYQNYRISKLLLDELTQQLAFTLAPRVRVNAIAPGAVLPPAAASPTFFRALTKAIPLRRTTDLASLLQAYTYLVENRCVTGQVLYVDGGWHLSGQP